MSDVIISAENISKFYLIGHNAARSERYTALRDVLARNARSLSRRTRDMLRGRAIVQGDEVEQFCALKDVSFDINRGEVVGIIGRNGAGKSTLLKVLSRITEPTKGRITLGGRVASLLEVGTGFHPELSGRENIYLNGAILGMKREEVKAKFDEIVAFAETEKFLDTPVKRYSSGMYVRLAFAVAAHLEPEILIVDEVLAVGDSQFQKKCLGKMQDVSKGDGRTVLFVSHNMSVVRALCSRAILFRHGQVVIDGPTGDVVAEHMAPMSPAGELIVDRRLDPALSLETMSIDPPVVPSGGSVTIGVMLRAFEATALYESSVIIHADNGQRVAILDLRTEGGAREIEAGEAAEYEIRVANLPLIEGVYEIGFYFRSDRAKDELFALRNLIVTAGQTGCLVQPYPAQNRGVVELNYTFSVEQKPRT